MAGAVAMRTSGCRDYANLPDRAHQVKQIPTDSRKEPIGSQIELLPSDIEKEAVSLNPTLVVEN